MPYLGKDGSGHCPQTIAECAVQIGISYGLLTSFPEKNSFCCNNEEWLFQTYVDIFVNGKNYHIICIQPWPQKFAHTFIGLIT